MTTVQASQRLAVHGIQITPIVIARYCRVGKIRASYTARGRMQREWDISESALAHYIESRKGSSTSSRAKEGWERRRRRDFARNQGQGLRDSSFPSYDDVETHDHRVAALNGQQQEVEHLEQHRHVHWWWNAAKGVIVGSVDVDDVKRYAAQVWMKRPAPTPVPAYIPGVG